MPPDEDKNKLSLQNSDLISYQNNTVNFDLESIPPDAVKDMLNRQPLDVNRNCDQFQEPLQPNSKSLNKRKMK